VDPPVSPERVFFCQADGEAGDAPEDWGSAGLAPLARVVLSGGQLTVPGQQRRWRDGKDPCPAVARDEPRQRGEPRPVSWFLPGPADLAAQHRVLVAEHEELSILRLVPTNTTTVALNNQRMST
jgi:hypothetical protein